MTRISILGLGSMGSALAQCLVGAGHTVGVWNRTPGKSTALADAGATVFDSADDAVAASDLTIICIKGHSETLDLVRGLRTPLSGKTICDMSTGDTADADALVSELQGRGAGYMLGMINAYTSGIGSDDVAILTVGGDGTWDQYGDVIRTLGGKSAHVGSRPAALAALFAGLFTVRQGFMFGMINGALACKKAGIAMDVFAAQIPASLKLVHDYYDLFARTVPTEDFDNAEASLKVYALAQQDALQTFRALGAPADFIELIHAQTKAALDDGYGDKQLTSLVKHL